ncbi:MAG: hypothetical protein R2759_13680 [Bacteroidales bacterium]
MFDRKRTNLKSSVSTIYQTFDGKDLYPSIEEKAANLLYLVTKNGEKRIADNALVALTLMIAVSKPEEKDTITKITVNLINKEK